MIRSGMRQVLEVDEADRHERGAEDEHRARTTEVSPNRAPRRREDRRGHELDGQPAAAAPPSPVAARSHGCTGTPSHVAGALARRSGAPVGHALDDDVEERADRDPGERRHRTPTPAFTRPPARPAPPAAPARIASTGARRPSQSSNAWAAWCTSIPRPPTVRGARGSAAARSSGVSSGWYTMSTTDLAGARGAPGRAGRPPSSPMPTEVAFTTRSALGDVGRAADAARRRRRARRPPRPGPPTGSRPRPPPRRPSASASTTARAAPPAPSTTQRQPGDLDAGLGPERVEEPGAVGVVAAQPAVGVAGDAVHRAERARPRGRARRARG